MKFYDSIGPNPRLVRMFMAEKGMSLDSVQIDLMGGENRRPPYLDQNPTGEMPALELDDGRFLAETIAICEYLEELQPDPPLIGADAEARATTRMWIRRIEYRITNPSGDGFRSAEGLAMFKDRRHCIPQAADDLKEIAQEGLAWLDEQIQGRDYIAGDQMTLADILFYCFADFAGGVGQPIDPAHTRVAALIERMAARPSAEQSLHPAAKAGGMRA
jgi:glutathione S-transferase